jgi:hypothetical protein
MANLQICTLKNKYSRNEIMPGRWAKPLLYHLYTIFPLKSVEFSILIFFDRNLKASSLLTLYIFAYTIYIYNYFSFKIAYNTLTNFKKQCRLIKTMAIFGPFA